MVILAYLRLSQICKKRQENMTIGKQIRKRRKELNMSVDELAQRIGKDRSTIYRYENGEISNMPIEMLPSMLDALETTPQELLATIITSNEWLTKQAENWFAKTEGYEFNDREVEFFHELAGYIIRIRNFDDYDERMDFLFMLLKQLNK